MALPNIGETITKTQLQQINTPINILPNIGDTISSDQMKQVQLNKVPINIQQQLVPKKENQNLFPITGEESLIEGAGKSLLNLPGQAYRFAKGAIDFLNPLTAIENVSKLPSAVYEASKEMGGFIPATVGALKEFPQVAYDQLTPPTLKKLLAGNGEEALKDLANDPFQVAPFLVAARGVAGKLGKGAAFDAAMEKVASPVIEPMTAIAKKGLSTLGTTTKFAASQTTGLSPETINTIIKDPKAFEIAEKSGTTRFSIANKVKNSIDTAIEDLSGLGKEYQAIREGKAPVVIPEGTIATTLSKYGLGLNEGKIVTTAESRPLSQGDISGIEQFINQYGENKVQTSNAFLNARKALDNLSSWDSSKTEMSDVIARDLRRVYDTEGKNQIPGLAKLDFQYAPQVQLLRQIKKDYIKPDGTLKDGAINKIANLLGKGKEPILIRLERIEPGVSKEIKIVKALEDIEVTRGQKVGTYIRAAAPGAVAFGIGGVPGIALGIITAILASPTIAVALLKTYGKAVGASSELIARIISNLDKGVPLKGEEKIIMEKVIQEKVKENIVPKNTGKTNLGVSKK